jgi:hypothetical protein
VISSIGTGKVTEIDQALRDCHVLAHEHETGTFRSEDHHFGSEIVRPAVSET